MNTIKKLKNLSFEGSMNILETFYPKTNNALRIIGMLVVLRKILKLICWIFKNILRPSRNLSSRYGKGTWALVTGSSDGIGKGIAFSLAKRGFNIILSARTVSKLQATRIQLIRQYPSTNVKIFQIDYKRSAQQGYLQNKVNEQLNDIEISILVNNVGVDVLDYYHNLSEETIRNLININCFSVSILNSIFIPLFLKRNKERQFKSAIVNVSSLAAEMPMPIHNIYSASKAFVDYLSRSLKWQYPSIDMISLRPSQVSTPMTYNKRTDIMTILPKDCAEGLLGDLGYQQETNGHFSHKLQSLLYSVVPSKLFNFIWMKFLAIDFMQERKKAQQQR